MRNQATCLSLIAALVFVAACSQTAPTASCPTCGPNQACEAGACVCREGFLDCDKEPSNGCEVEGSRCGECLSESDAEFCLRLGKNCDYVTDSDNCGRENTADCGTCDYPLICGGGGTANVCGQCIPEPDQQFCRRQGKDCGLLAGDNNCGQPNTANCGECTTPETCGGGGRPNVCGSGCQAEEPAQTCAREGKNCGELTAPNNCGVVLTVGCGECELPETCGGGGVPNLCGVGCQPEGPAATCEREGKDCGMLAAQNNCGTQVTAICGDCELPETCGGAGTPNVCGTGCQAEAAAQTCVRQGRECGPLTAPNNCGVTVSVQCGGCPTGEACSDQGRCACATGTTCAAQGIECGPASDGCGGTLNCGTCIAGEGCVAGQCQPQASTCTSDAHCATGNCTNNVCEPRTECLGSDPVADENLECTTDSQCSGYLECRAYSFILPGRCFESCNPVGDGVGSCCLSGRHCGKVFIGILETEVCCEPGQTYETGLGLPLYCNPTDKSYKCNSDGDCPGAAWGLSRCDSSAGQPGTCVGCLVDSDCLHVCVNKTCVRCRSAADCSHDAPFCVDNECLGCRSDADCGAATPFCNANSDSCVECASNASCSGDEPYCETYYGNCRECLNDGHCPASAPRCASGGSCVECVLDEDCGQGLRCSNYACVL